MQKKLLLNTTQAKSRLYVCSAILMWGAASFAATADSVVSQSTTHATIGVEAAPVCTVRVTGLAKRLVLEDIPKKNGFNGLSIGHVTATCDNNTSRRALAFLDTAAGNKTLSLTLTNTSDSVGKMLVWTLEPASGTSLETIGSDVWIVGDNGADFSPEIVVSQPTSGQVTVGEYTLSLVAGAYE